MVPLLRRANGYMYIKLQHKFINFICMYTGPVIPLLHRFPAPRGCSLSPGFSYGQKSYIYIYIWSRLVLPDLGIAPTGLLTGLIRLSRNALLFPRIHQNAPFLLISGLSPVSGYLYDLSANMIIHFSTWSPLLLRFNTQIYT